MKPMIIHERLEMPDNGIVVILMRADRIRFRSRELRRNGFTFCMEDTPRITALCGGKTLKVSGVYEGTPEMRKLIKLCDRWHWNIAVEN